MKIVIWIIQGLAALAFLAAGSMKLMTPYEDLLANPQMGWVNDFSAMQVKLIAAAEVLGALGLIIPMFVSKIKYLVPIAGICLAILMIGAAATHISRGEPFIPNIILILLPGLTAYFRRDMLKFS